MNRTLYPSLNYRDHQVDLGDALTAIAVSLLALASLMSRRWLFRVARAATVFGVAMGITGLAGLHLHPDTLSKMRSRPHAEI
jgi:hypothetical protein